MSGAPDSGPLAGELPAVWVVHPLQVGAQPDPAQMREFESLAEACDFRVAGVSQVRRAAKGSHLLGKGTEQRLRDEVRAGGQLHAVLIDAQLRPGDERTLQRNLDCPVIDRTRLILEIFSRRARTAEARQQVELAKCRYESNRLVRGWTHLERQRGAVFGRGGPGEKQIELDRRLLRQRIRTLERRVQENLRHRQHRSARAESTPGVAIVGYTSAGKTSLFNALVGERQFASDMLFATLDPRRRRLELAPAGSVQLSDTVGFIRDVPSELVAAFEATLSEVRTARLLLLAVDASSHDAEGHEAEVVRTLEKIGAGDIPRLRVETKADLRPDLPPGACPGGVRVSALRGPGLDALREAVAQSLWGKARQYRLLLEPREGRLRSQLYARSAVLEEQVREDGRLKLRVLLPAAELRRLVDRFSSSPDLPISPPCPH